MSFEFSDPLGEGGVAGFGQRLRSREISIESVTTAYLNRIHSYPSIAAFEYIADAEALALARRLDSLLEAGTDLGPLMGLPIAVKDVIAVDGMPCTAGSNMDVSTLIPKEGPFVAALKKAGCVILGKTKTVEFALGAGVTYRGTPWNVRDEMIHRTPGGSSSGSAAAVAAGLCAFAIGGDTGGSIRIPASFCGIYGLKTTLGLWPTEGTVPLSTSFDTIGLLTRTAEDAAIVYTALSDKQRPPCSNSANIRLGYPSSHFFDNIDASVSAAFQDAVLALQNSGFNIIPIDMPEAGLVEPFSIVSPVELLSTLGRDRFLANRDKLDPHVAERISAALNITADSYINIMRSQKDLRKMAAATIRDVDAIISPTTLIMACVLNELDDSCFRQKYNKIIVHNTRPANILNMCAASIPFINEHVALPVGFQIMCDAYNEEKLLSLSMAIERILGEIPPPKLDRFADRSIRINRKDTVVANV